jgi:predicted nucleotidyltransferase
LPHWKKFDKNIIAGGTVLDQDFKEFIQSLNDNGVRYLVVGGYAVALHGYPPRRIDILTTLPGVEFSERYPSHTTVEMEGVSVNFIGLENLKKNKKATGRHQDLADLENLE